MTHPMPLGSSRPPVSFGSRGLWQDGVATEPARPALTGDTDADVAIVGAGYTGLWTALHLVRADPRLRVVVLEKEVAGFGASGRNGGWCSALFPVSLDRLAQVSGADAAVRMQRVLQQTVRLVGADALAEGIDCDFEQGGYLELARNEAQLARLQASSDHASAWGFGPPDHELLGAGQVREMTGAAGVLAGSWTPHCAALHPARLVRGLARAVQARGVRLFEQSPVTGIEPRRVRTPHGTVRAEHVIVATEGYTAGLDGWRRQLAPVYSLMVATEPLAPTQLEAVGLDGRATFADNRHVVTYGQRTADGRVAFGARGAPYHFGSRVSPRFELDGRVHAGIEQTLLELFPDLRGMAFTHRWGGCLGVPRDWFPRVHLDRATGIGTAGGYVGDGVAASHLAGRTLAALVLGDDPDELVTLPWVGPRARLWEPEPLRWAGINGVAALMDLADAQERRSGRPSRAAELFWRHLAR